MRTTSACVVLLLSAIPCLCGQGQNTENRIPQASESKGMPPRATPGEYQAHTQVGTVTLAAEFMGHSVPRPEGPLTTEDYVIVETGLFGPPESRLKISISDFALRVNGKKSPLTSEPYTVVLRSLKDPDWVPPDPPKKKEKSSFGSGGGDDGPPPPVHVPIELQRAMAQYTQKSSLPEGERGVPVAGLLFFEFRGKVQSIHSIELIYSGPTGKATLALQR